MLPPTFPAPTAREVKRKKEEKEEEAEAEEERTKTITLLGKDACFRQLVMRMKSYSKSLVTIC
jgi:hypothetical protein